MATNNAVTRRANSENGSFRNIRERQAIANRASFRSFNDRYSGLSELQLNNSRNLLQFRQDSQSRIDTINREYSEITQNVLNDKTLDFLIQHSNINAPTLTSIFAGFELARASQADRLGEQRDVAIASIEAANQRQTDLNQAEQTFIQAQSQLATTNFEQNVNNAALISQGDANDLQELQADNNTAQDQAANAALRAADNAARTQQVQITADASVERQRISSDTNEQVGSFLDFARQGNANVQPLVNANQITTAPAAINNDGVGADGIPETLRRQPENINDLNEIIESSTDEATTPATELLPVEPEPVPEITEQQRLTQIIQRDDLANQFIESRDESLLAPLNILNNEIGTEGLSDSSGIVAAIAALPSDESDQVSAARSNLLTKLDKSLVSDDDIRVQQIQATLDSQRQALASITDPAQRSSMQAAIAQQEQVLRDLRS